MKLISLNVWGDHLTQEQIEFFKTEHPDAICMQEVFGVDMPVYEQALGMKGTFVPLVSIDEENQYGDAPRGAWGIAILSKYPLSNIQHRFYQYESARDSKFPAGKPDELARALLWADITVEGKTYTLATTHFTWAPTAEPTPTQLAVFPKLLKILEGISEFILCGDFNAPRGYPIFDQLASLYTDNIPLTVPTTIDPIHHRAKGLKLIIDVLFSTPRYVVSDVRVAVGVSDHCAILGNIQIHETIL